VKITLQDGVYAAAYSDDNGICVRLFKTEEGALKWKQELALQYWDCHFTEPMPVNKTHREIADHYFEWATEYFSIDLIKEINP